ncbi:hypothetical protein HZA33_01010 [Candidatus Pacearchaeota archaeon]|nr:hypothetical protein [Candidatus Pacearchaeota archaeon]
MKKRITIWRVRRIFLHVLLGIAILLLAIFGYNSVKWYLFWTLGIGIILSLVSIKYKIPGIYFMLKKFEKPQYLHRFPGKSVLFFVAGCLLVLKLFPENIALASIVILTFADPTSFLVGSFGNIKHKKPFNRFKNVEGTLAGIIVSFIAASFFVSMLDALLTSVVAMLAEAFVIKLGDDIIDDNFFVPVIAGTVLYVLARLGI